MCRRLYEDGLQRIERLEARTVPGKSSTEIDLKL